jgi:hypothetical protein
MDLMDLEAEQACDMAYDITYDITDMAVVLDDDPPEQEPGKAATGVSGVVAAILKAGNGV